MISCILNFKIMALFKSFVLGDVRKSVANGYSIARGKRNTIRNPRTPGQLTQRAKMKALQRTSLYFAPVAELGFPGRKGGNTFYNAFVKANMKAVMVDEEYNPTIDYEKIVCAEGNLQDGMLTVSLNEDVITITQEAQSRWSVLLIRRTCCTWWFTRKRVTKSSWNLVGTVKRVA